MTDHDVIKRAARTALERGLTDRQRIEYGSMNLIDLADDIAAEVLEHLDGNHFAVVHCPGDGHHRFSPMVTVVLPGGAVIEADTQLLDEWHHVYVPYVEGFDVEDIVRRLVLAPSWWPEDEPVRFARRPVDGVWIIAAAVWTLSAMVGRVAPRAAMRLDRLASRIEAIADGEVDE